MDKIKLESELSNYNAWLSGLYVFNAISVSLYNCFGRKNGQPAENYIEQPYDFDKKPKSKEEIELEERLEREEQIKESLKRMKKALKNDE